MQRPDEWMILATVVAFVIKGMTGFANTLVFTSMMSFGSANVEISPIELITGYPSNLYIAWRERNSISKSTVFKISLLVIIGSIPGAFLLKNADTSLLKILFGILVILLGFEMLLREKQQNNAKPNRILAGGIGLLSGLLCGLFGVGALLAAYFSRTTKNVAGFRGNICAVFVFENTFRILLYSATGIITWNTLKISVQLLPFMAGGLFAGTLLTKVINERIMKKIVILLLILSGCVLILHHV
ncbi:MAG: sulfite exporter TauE/SafE family protein [Lachnospiraceae bacterium]|nr:sulfite exporter TauE/SafE family protein [Lachnospiraceae bacterium]